MPAEPTVPAAPVTPAARPGQALPGQPADLSPEAPVLPLVPFFRPPPAVGRPLPDAVAMRVIPDTCPPYDDEPGRRAQAGRARAQDAPGAADAAAVPGAPAGPGAGSAAASPVTGPGTAAPGGPAALPGWPCHFAQILAETLAGSRPAQQIVPWTTEQAQRHIQRLGPLMSAGSQPRVRRVVTFRPSADVLEMTVVIGVGPRVRALAVRMERTRPAGRRARRDGPAAAATGRGGGPAPWVCTAVEAA